MASAAKSRIESTRRCYRATIPNSSGIFFGEMPLQTSLPLLLAQIIVIFAATRITHALFRPLGLPQVISHVIAGIILGPTLLSRNQTFRDFIFPDRGWVILNVLGLISFTLFIFVTGVKTELRLIYSHGAKSVALAVVACFLPFISVFVTCFLLRLKATGMVLWAFSMRWALTSNTVVAALLDEFNLLTTKLGRLAMSVSLIIDLTSTSAQAILLSVSQTPETLVVTAALKVAAAGVLFFAAIIFVARPLALWIIWQTPQGEVMDEAYLLLIVMIALGLALVGELIGQQYIMGPMLLGLLMPVGPPLGTTLADRMERLVVGFFMPMYTADVGIKMDMRTMLRGELPAIYVSILIMVSVMTKLIGVCLFCHFCRMPFRDSIVLSLMMSSKGIMDVTAYSNWRSYKAIRQSEYSINVMAMVIVGGVTAALMKHLYKPSMRYLAYRRRTIQHSRRNEELRLLVCVHNSDNVVPILALLEVSYLAPDAPICVYLFHLSNLVGRTASVLFPYQQKQKRKQKTIMGHVRSGSKSVNGPSSSTTSESDQIVNAFRFLERHKAGGLMVLPFICIAPYDTMHDDVCNVALEKNVSLIIIPFHKHIEASGSVQSSIQEMNLRVLTYAPCSVAILVHHGLSGGCVNRVAVLFLGGADDREALAYAARIAENPSVSLSVVRLRPKADARDGEGSDSCREELLDNEAVEEFKATCMDSGRVQYNEEFVEDAAGTVEVIRDMSKDFTLLIVGRRDGVESTMTEGMDAWSEYPELGLVGDVLASSDFGKTVSTMVVQQQLQRNMGRG